MKGKKLEITILCITIAFAVFTAGFFIGRSSIDGGFIIETQYAPETDNTASPDSSVSTNDTETVPDRSSPVVSYNYEIADSDSEPGLININTAEHDELTELPGIGDVLAERIIDYRDTHGNFSKKEDIRNVSGIGEVTYNKISSMITVGN